MKEQFDEIMEQKGILKYTDFFSTGNLNIPSQQNHPSTQIRTLFGFLNLYEILDDPLLIFHT